MKPSEATKLMGMKLDELAEISGESVQTLNNWWKNYPRRFQLILTGASLEKMTGQLKQIDLEKQQKN